mgnify:CR=1 FL=1
MGRRRQGDGRCGRQEGRTLCRQCGARARLRDRAQVQRGRRRPRRARGGNAITKTVRDASRDGRLANPTADARPRGDGRRSTSGEGEERTFGSSCARLSANMRPPEVAAQVGALHDPRGAWKQDREDVLEVAQAVAAHLVDVLDPAVLVGEIRPQILPKETTPPSWSGATSRPPRTIGRQPCL